MNAHPPSPDPSTPPGPPRRHAPGLMARLRRFAVDRFNLRGAITDLTLANSGLILKLPTERLFTVDGVPREAFVAD